MCADECTVHARQGVHVWILDTYNMQFWGFYRCCMHATYYINYAAMNETTENNQEKKPVKQIERASKRLNIIIATSGQWVKNPDNSIRISYGTGWKHVVLGMWRFIFYQLSLMLINSICIICIMHTSFTSTMNDSHTKSMYMYTFIYLVHVTCA